MFSTALKDLAVELDIFGMTATQTSGDLYENTEIKGAKYVRGSKAIIDKADCGIVCYRAGDVNQQIIDRMRSTFGYNPANFITDIHKNRRGKYVNVRIYSDFDYGTCRLKDYYLCDSSNNKINDFEIMKLKVKENIKQDSHQSNFLDILKGL